MNIDLIKNLSKLDWRRILTTVILFSLSIFYTSGGDSSTTSCPLFSNCITSPSIDVGYPLRFIHYPDPDLSFINLLIDLLFWYSISCALIFAWDKIRNKKLK